MSEKAWEPTDDREDLAFAMQDHPDAKLGLVPLSKLASSDCRRRLKMDCDEKHEPTAEGAKEYIEELASSMRSGGVPRIEVSRSKEGKFFLLDGHHRVTAARDLGLTYAPAIIFPSD